MAAISGVGRRVDEVVARYFDADLPSSEGLPGYVAPLPEWLENVGLRLAWLIVLVNLVGTAFGFWYYRLQLEATPLAMWVFVPDSPMATLFIALSLAAWRLDVDADWLHVLAFFGCIKLGLWTPYVQLGLQSPAGIGLLMYWFLVLSHLAMAVEAFLIHRYAAFSVPAVAVATVWYTANDVLDYLYPVVGDFHHTVLRAEYVDGTFDHTLVAHDLAAACAVVLTVICIFLALATRVEKLRLGTD
ncbi:DUF1405 domain-containing protein [Halobacteriales archaeon Cl-PHB]